ncbi:MAG: RICIN domain-containing protein [Gemmatimonadaceae bacterium]
MEVRITHKERAMRLALTSATVCGLLLSAPVRDAHAQRGANAFNTVFREDATGRNDANTYLLTYLVTLVFPDQLDQLKGSSGGTQVDLGYVRELHMYPEKFLLEYRKLTEYLFYDPDKALSATNARPEYAFIQGSQGGYDPEAMLVSTPRAVIVVVRGTDRVGEARNEFDYNFAEWLGSDFATLGKEPDVRGVPGKVHAGFWFSLKAPVRSWAVAKPGEDTAQRQTLVGTAQDKEFRERVYQQIAAFGGATKKLWIVGHSLGSAQTQTLGAWLDARVGSNDARQGFHAQGLMAVAAPHVGNREFVDYMNRRFPGAQLQRFEFVDDPVTLFPPYAIGYERAGTRVYYDDIETIEFGARERSIAEDAKLIPALAGQATDFSAAWMTDGNKFLKIRAASALFCFHFPHWYLSAAYSQLNPIQRSRVPLPLGVPNGSDFYRPCGPLNLARGRRNPAAQVAELRDTIVKAVEGAVEAVAYNVGQLLDNTTGAAIAEGTYYLRTVDDRKYLEVGYICVNQNGCKVQLGNLGQTTANNRFTVTKQGLGYKLRNGADHFVEVDANDLFENNAQIQVWGPNGPFGGHLSNQVWRFYKVPNRSNLYVLVNEASGKALEAAPPCTPQGSCRVRQWTPKSSASAQVWILEKAQ